MKTRFIFNPVSGRHARNARLLPLLRDFIGARALDADLVATEGPGHATELARAAVQAMGPERCLYGTDAPYGFHGEDGSYDYGEIRGWVERMPVSTEMRSRILGGNFREMVAV